jgi:hypothetical protein
MKHFLLFLVISFPLLVKGQLLDTSYTNIFTQVSEYRNYYEVYLGNMGMAKYNLLNPFDDNNPEVKNLFPVNSSTGTYTDIFYVLGSGTENYFDLEHHQYLAKDLFGEAKLLKTNSQGIYRFQQADLSDFRIKLNYSPEDKRYNATVIFQNYKRFNEVNAGVPDTSFFALMDSGNANVKTTFPVNIEGIGTSYVNFMQYKALDINYAHNFKLYNPKTDSGKTLKLEQTLSYNRTKRNFTLASATDFFDDIFLDSFQTQDSMQLEQLSHTLGISFEAKDFKINLGFGQNYFEYNSLAPFEVHLENFLYGRLTYAKNKFKLNSQAEFLTSEGKYESHYIKNNFVFEDSSKSIFQKYSGRLNYITDLPELYFNSYSANNFNWNRTNDLNKIVQASFSAENIDHGTKVGVNFESQSNAVYFDTSSQIGQTSISLLSFSLAKEFRLNNWMYFSIQINVQDILSSSAIEVPNFVTNNKLYFRGKLIKKTLSFDAGINVLYYSNFNARAYNPSLDAFFVQENQSVGNYLFIDVFAEFYLRKSFAFFMTVTHVNSNLLTPITGDNYLATTLYPRQDRAFKFGFKWRLFD